MSGFELYANGEPTFTVLPVKEHCFIKALLLLSITIQSQVDSQNNEYLQYQTRC